MPSAAQVEVGPTTATVFVPGMPACPSTSHISGVVTPATNKKGAGRVVALDAGHGGKETGAVSMRGVAEKSANLKIALKLASLLKAEGFEPALTRLTDSAVNQDGRDLNGDGKVDNDDDLQARVDIANRAGADILVSIHNNGSTDPSVRGTATYYCDAHPRAAESLRLATSLQTHLVASLRAAGYSPLDEGAKDDAPLAKPFGHLFVVGPKTSRVARPALMPGALGETLYLTNPTEARLLEDDSVLTALANGYLQGINVYFQER